MFIIIIKRNFGFFLLHIRIQIFSGGEKRGSTNMNIFGLIKNTNIFGLTKKGKYKNKLKYSAWYLQIQIQIFVTHWFEGDMSMLTDSTGLPLENSKGGLQYSSEGVH